MFHFLFKKKEYVDGCRKHGNTAETSVLHRVFDLFDVDKDGQIDEQEFYWALNYMSATEH